MNANETRQLCGRVAAAYGRAFTPDTITEWGRHLAQRDSDEANQALDRIISNGEPGPSIARLLAEISAAHPRRAHTRPIGDTDCRLCEGTGFVASPPTIEDFSMLTTPAYRMARCRCTDPGQL